jgi:alpha-galactosidase
MTDHSMNDQDQLEESPIVWVPGERPFAQRRTIDLGPDSRVQLELLTDDAVHVPEVSLSSSPLDGELVLTFLASSATNPYQVELTFAAPDATALWQPGSSQRHGVYPPSWADAQRVSTLDGFALRALLTTSDTVAVTVAVDAGARPVAMRAGAVEENGKFLVTLRPERAGSSMRVRLGLNEEPFNRGIASAADWLAGITRDEARQSLDMSSRSSRPVLCSWYSMHLSVNAGKVYEQAAQASALGFGTILIDDGWQTSEVMRGYATTGDWSISAAKFADPKQFTRSLEDLGLATVWWIGTPFIGDSSQAKNTSMLTNHDARLEAWTADIRSHQTRQTLGDRILAHLDDAGGVGLKLDFLEVFARTPDSEAPADADFDTLEDAALDLLGKLRDGVQVRVTDGIIEFREPYFSPRASEFATAVRVSDSPLSHVENRVGITDLRLVTRGVFVHSDPLMWTQDARPATVGIALINSLFGIPQVSVDLTSAPSEHLRVLKFWLDNWARWKDVLLTGEFISNRPDLNYPILSATAGETTVFARYAPHPISIPQTSRTVHIANTDEAPTVVYGLERHSSIRAVLYGPTGSEISLRLITAPRRIEEFLIPVGGLLTLRSG